MKILQPLCIICLSVSLIIVSNHRDKQKEIIKVYETEYQNLVDGIDRILEEYKLEKVEETETEVNLGVLTHDAEYALIKAIAKFPEEVLEIVNALQKSTWGTSFQSNKLTTYCYTLATLFSKFYDSCPVLKAETPIRDARLELVRTFKTTMANCLRLLGIPIVERM